GEEDRLMTERRQRFMGARERSSTIFVVGSILALLCGAGAVTFLRAQRRELERQRTLLEGIIESVDEGIIALDPARQVLALNEVARAMWNGAAPREHWPADWSS